jgi:quercetin dioxygenase-like cupin family protein
MLKIQSSDIKTKLAPAEYFTGTVWIEPLSETDLLEVQVFRVTFSPGARTAWHTHPKGQTLVITSGNGLFQKRGEAVQTMQQCDVIVIPEGEEHWHGASPNSLMQHLAIQAVGSSGSATWLEKVTDEDYLSFKLPEK